jgi:hypothetical protein
MDELRRKKNGRGIFLASQITRIMGITGIYGLNPHPAFFKFRQKHCVKRIDQGIEYKR